MKGFVIFAKTFYASDNMAVIPHFNLPEINKKAVKEKKPWKNSVSIFVIIDRRAADQLRGLSGSDQHRSVYGGEVCAGLSALCSGNDR